MVRNGEGFAVTGRYLSIYIPVTPGGYSSVDDYRWSMTRCHRQVPSIWYRLQNIITNISSTAILHILSSTIWQCNFCLSRIGYSEKRTVPLEQALRFCFKYLEKATLHKDSPQNTLSKNISRFQSLTYWIVYRSHRHAGGSALRLTSYRRSSSIRDVCLLICNAWSTSCMIKCQILLVRNTRLIGRIVLVCAIIIVQCNKVPCFIRVNYLGYYVDHVTYAMWCLQYSHHLKCKHAVLLYWYVDPCRALMIWIYSRKQRKQIFYWRSWMKEQ